MNPGVILQALKYLKEVEYFERRLATRLSHASVGWFLSLPGFMAHSEKPQPTDVALLN